MNKSHAKRQRAEKRFRLYGKVALGFAICFLVIVLGNIILRGYQGFTQTEIQLGVVLDMGKLEMLPGQTAKDLSPARFMPLINETLKTEFPDVIDKKELRELYKLASSGAGATIKKLLEEKPELIGTNMTLWVPAGQEVRSAYLNGNASPRIQQLMDQHLVRTVFNGNFLTHADSRVPELAGFWGAIAGSLFTLIVTLLVAFPLGVASAVYLEEFAKKSIFVDVIEVNINNLAAVPSIVFGLLGLSLYINVLHLPRSAPLVGGLTLALMVLPVIIIATRTALKSVPPSIRQAALGLGASNLQVVWHHTLPLAMPGIMTGTILAVARAIGETAPLLMIGMVAFVADVPHSFLDAATVMPVQIYLWAGSPEAAFAEKTAAAILVLIVLLLAMNALAIVLRKKFEVRW
jgi:phosphate transport system permease protein